MESVWVKSVKFVDEIEDCAKSLIEDTPAEGLSIKQLLVLGSLFEKDGQHPSELAHAVGTPATSFTPIRSPGLMITSRSIRLRSSRTFPGQS